MTIPLRINSCRDTMSSLTGRGASSLYMIHLSPPFKEKPAFSTLPPLERILDNPNILRTLLDHWILKLPTIVITCR